MKTSINQINVLTLLAFGFTITALANYDSKAAFNRLDANGDGRISATESETATFSKFSRADTNGDGTLTKGELTTFMIEEKGKSAKKSEEKSEKKIAKLDSNSDGVLSKQEFVDGMKKKFNEADTNKDGSVTEKEMESSR